jgi:hypothetical protein
VKQDRTDETGHRSNEVEGEPIPQFGQKKSTAYVANDKTCNDWGEDQSGPNRCQILKSDYEVMGATRVNSRYSGMDNKAR